MKRLQCTGAPLKLRKFGTLCHVQLCPNPTCACSSWQFPRLASSPRPPLALPASPPRDCPSQSVHSSNDIWTFCYIGRTVADQPVPWKVAQLLSRTASPPRGCPLQMVREENRFGRSVMLGLLWQTNLYLGSIPSCKAALCGLCSVQCPSALQNGRLRSLRPLCTWDSATKEGRREPWKG